MHIADHVKIENKIITFSQNYIQAHFLSGFFHEHSRPDRNQFITVNESAIELVEAEDFLFHQKKHYEICRNCESIGPYDLHSLMHYPAYLGTKNRTVITIKSGVCRGSKCRIGQREGLSPLDVEDIQQFYDCGK